MTSSPSAKETPCPKCGDDLLYCYVCGERERACECDDEPTLGDCEECEAPCYGNRECGTTAIEPHTCPFQEEINDDSESLCNCCDKCAYDCAMEV